MTTARVPQLDRQRSAFAPATVANVACGFDVLGFAIGEPGDVVSASLTGDRAIVIERISGDGGILPREPDRNTAGVAVRELLAATNSPYGVRLSVDKRMPLGSGMGSSAASAAAALVVVNSLLGEPLSRAELLPFAMRAEAAACGAAHGDNVAPALLGGFVLIRCYEPLDVVRIPSPSELSCALVHPHIEIKTSDARKVLKGQVALKDAITQWGNTAGLVAGLYSNDYGLIGRSLTDVIIEPTRSLLIPGFSAVKKAALENGALGCSISGSGPSVFALCRGIETAARVAAAMRDSFATLDIGSESYVSPVNAQGAFLLEEPL